MHDRAGNLVATTLAVPFGFGFLIDLVTLAPHALVATKFVFVWTQLHRTCKAVSSGSGVGAFGEVV